MGIAYLSYTLVIFLVFTLIVIREKLSWWWAGVVLVLPFSAPYFLGRSKKGNFAAWSVLVILGLAAAAGGEAYLYKDYKARNRYSHLPPVVRQMITLNETVERSTVALYQASAQLDSLGLVQSRITDIKKTLDLIADMRELIRRNLQDINTLVSYIHSHRDLIRNRELGWAFRIAEFYQDSHVIQHQQSRKIYLAAFEQMLQYTYDHFDQIMEVKSTEHRANYDAYYLRYRGVADRHNQVNRQRIQFQDTFVGAHPEVKPFLPGSHHLKPFKFWDRYSF